MRHLVWILAASIGVSILGGCVVHDHDDHDHDHWVEGHEHEHWTSNHWEHDPDWDQYHHEH